MSADALLRDGGEPIILAHETLRALGAANGQAVARKRRIVWFAGGGGSSEGMKLAYGEGPDAALNHWPVAVYAHMRHNPGTDHYCADAFDVHPMSVFPGEPIGEAWFSPDCTDFSKAKGKALRSERRRGLAWVVVDWAFHRRPDVMIVENVPEFLGWGPLYRDGHPQAGERIPQLEGLTFEAWRRALVELGGVVEWKVIVSADHGDPTTRERLYVIIRFDGKPIVWPAATHAPRKLAVGKGLTPWVGAHTQIDFSIPTPSIFMTREEARAQKLRVNRPLKPATLKRVARGVDRFVISAADPFIVSITNQTWGGDRARDIREPSATITTAKGGEFAMAAPTLAKFRKDSAGGDLREPGPTVTANSYQKRPGGAAPLGIVAPNLVRTDMASGADRNGIRDPREPGATVTGAGGFAVASAYLVPNYGERAGQAPRVLDVAAPYPTVVPKQNGGKLAAVHLHRQFGSTVSGCDAEEPAPTVMVEGAGGKIGACAAFLSTFQQNIVGSPVDEPALTCMAGATRHALAGANLISYYGNDVALGSDMADPGRTVTGKARHGVSAAFMHQANTGMVGRPLDDPSSTIVLKGCTQQLVEARLAVEGGNVGRRDRVLAFLWEHFGPPTAEEWAAPTATLEARRKFGLVKLATGQGDDVAVWMIVDIGLRMLKPRELAGLMGMGPEFDLATDVHGKPISITDQTHLIGNMVTRHTSAALLAANRADPLPLPQTERSAA